MDKKIIAVCDSTKCAQALEKAGEKLGYCVRSEVQNNESIINEIPKYDIESATIILFATSAEVECIENIERFIDREYYEADPKYVIEDAEAVINEILLDLN